MEYLIQNTSNGRKRDISEMEAGYIVEGLQLLAAKSQAEIDAKEDPSWDFRAVGPSELWYDIDWLMRDTEEIPVGQTGQKQFSHVTSLSVEKGIATVEGYPPDTGAKPMTMREAPSEPRPSA